MRIKKITKLLMLTIFAIFGSLFLPHSPLDLSNGQVYAEGGDTKTQQEAVDWMNSILNQYRGQKVVNHGNQCVALINSYVGFF